MRVTKKHLDTLQMARELYWLGMQKEPDPEKRAQLQTHFLVLGDITTMLQKVRNEGFLDYHFANNKV